MCVCVHSVSVSLQPVSDPDLSLACLLCLPCLVASPALRAGRPFLAVYYHLLLSLLTYYLMLVLYSHFINVFCTFVITPPLSCRCLPPAGCIIAELATGHPLFPGRSHHEQLWLVLKACGTHAISERQLEELETNPTWACIRMPSNAEVEGLDAK